MKGEVLGREPKRLAQGDRELGSSEEAGSPPVAADHSYLEVWDLVAFPQRDLEYVHQS